MNQQPLLKTGVITILSVQLFACSKALENQQGLTLPKTVTSDESYNYVLPLTLVSGTTNWYTQGSLEFQFPYSTGPFWNGEGVTALQGIAPMPNEPLISYVLTGNGGFVAYLSSMSTGDASALVDSIASYQKKWDAAEMAADTVTPAPAYPDTVAKSPALSTFLSLLPTNTQREIVDAGFVIRDSSAPSTYAVAPAAFKPVIKGDAIIELGAYWPSAYNYYYELDFFGDSYFGTLSKVEWFLGSGDPTEHPVYSYNLTSTPVSGGSFLINGTVTISPGTAITLTNASITPGATP